MVLDRAKEIQFTRYSPFINNNNSMKKMCTYLQILFFYFFYILEFKQQKKKKKQIQPYKQFIKTKKFQKQNNLICFVVVVVVVVYQLVVDIPSPHLRHSTQHLKVLPDLPPRHASSVAAGAVKTTHRRSRPKSI